MSKKLKVLHGLVNYGTQAGLFAMGLREKGIDAISVTAPDPFKRQTDIELEHGRNVILRVFKGSWNLMYRIYCFFKYNTFHFYFGTSLIENQIDLPFYKLFGKKVVMEYLGYDVQLYEYSIKKYDITNVKYYKSHEVSMIYDKKKLKRLSSERKYLNKQIVCAPYLSEFVKDSVVLPLAIDLREFRIEPKEILDNEIVILHTPTNKDNKGTSFIVNAIDQLIGEGYNIKFILAEGFSHAEIKQKYKECDLFIDQMLAGWYGTASIEAMALGKPTICFIRESYFEHINYGADIPIINAKPSNIYEVLKFTIENKHLLPDIGLKSRKFVEKVHDLAKLSEKLINIYQSL
jgi:glycosyltransferase involved in cell wall biosynthesis